MTLCLPSIVGQHEECMISITNANETRDLKGEHKFKVRGEVPGYDCMSLYVCNQVTRMAVPAGQLIFGDKPAQQQRQVVLAHRSAC